VAVELGVQVVSVFEDGDDVGMAYVVCDPDAVHPDRWEVRPGVNYVAGHRAARVVANRLAVAMGRTMPSATAGIRADVRADGSPMVWVGFDIEIAERLVEIVGRMSYRAGGGDVSGGKVA